MQALLVTHTHWDREWYRTFQSFRARLVDAVDRVLDHCAADPGYRFLLDGQAAVLEDYLEIRPERGDELKQRCAEGRIAIGPWYVQPDSLLPSGEAHVRNLLLGRLVGEGVGPVSRVGYTPDSFGHPAQLPQLLAGFGIGSFVYWRGHGDEMEELAAEYVWEAPDGSAVLACHLAKGYFSAATAPGVDLEEAAQAIARTAKALAARTRSGVLLLLNGVDHAAPEPRTEALAAAIAGATGFEVRRGLLEDFVAAVQASEAERPRHLGELVGARVSPLLPGVWSTRTWIKLRNRRAEALLEGWAEPWAALAVRHGLADERPALRVAWKALLQNQAHDSLCGCSRDAVHEQMRPRFDAAEELARETTERCLERLAGLGPERIPPFTAAFDVAVWNPSPRARTDVVRFPIEPHPYAVPHPDPRRGIHPMVLQDVARWRFTVDGAPARLVPSEENGRLVLVPGRRAYDLEFVAADVPAFGWRRVRVARVEEPERDRERFLDEARGRRVKPGGPKAQVAAGDVAVELRDDGTFDVAFGDRRFERLGGLDDVGDRGDTYDFDPVTEGPGLELVSVSARRLRDASGIQVLRVKRKLRLPRALAEGRRARSRKRATLRVWTELRVAPGVPRVDLRVRVDNTARDHRLRLLFPVGSAVEAFDAATTFDVARRTPGAPEDAGWVQRAVATFPHQGFVSAGGLSVVAPGLAEAEVTAGDPAAIAITLLRGVGFLSRHDLETRPGLAGPGTATPAAQCEGLLEAELALLPGLDPAAAREAELGLRAVVCGDAPRVAEGASLLALEPPELLLSAAKPAEDGRGLVVRVLNPTDVVREARLRLGFPFEHAEPVRLDETPTEAPLARDGETLRFPVPPRALRSVRVV